MRRTRSLLTALLPIALLLAACSSTHKGDSLAGDTSVPTSDSTAPTSTAAGDTTTSEAATTTSTVAEEPFVLHDDGIGGVHFGQPAAAALDALTTHLGPYDTDESRDYPDPDGAGGWMSIDGEFGFASPAGREVCWLLGLCVEFGGDDPASLVFLGWHYGGDTAGTLATGEGATIGSRWSDFPSFEVGSGGCYSIGYGMVEGIHLTLESLGDPFSSFDDSGNYVESTPDPADVSVVRMEAGDVPVFLFGDC